MRIKCPNQLDCLLNLKYICVCYYTLDYSYSINDLCIVSNHINFNCKKCKRLQHPRLVKLLVCISQTKELGHSNEA